MSENTVRFTGLNLVCADVDATLAFYRLLGAELPEDAIWRTDSGPHHTDGIQIGTSCELELDSRELARVYDAGYRTGATTETILGFGVPTRDAVDDYHQRLVDAGYQSRQEPYDAFWGARYAIVADPDGRHVGLMSPNDPSRHTDPPGL